MTDMGDESTLLTDAQSESGSSAAKVLQDQDFRKIRVVLAFDEEDRRGDPALEDQPDQSDSESGA